MKATIFILFFIIFNFGFSQNNYIVKTEDGRRVLLKTDFTWEYIDAEKATTNTSVASINATCNVADDFEEPALDQKIQQQLKKGRATINHVKNKVAKDNNCTVDDVLLLSVSEQKSKASYTFCANGNVVKYKRVGNTIIKNTKIF
ncbi:DUF3157 family protein [Sabulilitoribacter multivorans]|uniref:DUF3157 family protein n=1 Tax=Flaviramulus multivorans TaxID=1304750 RepID=A0ABS9IG64_9FLAO|nr:DUF3157 family protein [Flaviramulus multivorans]MCF7559738.1 DUF3157 family protein [Flaviramulus multivorans]